jgi:hypothetical protein
MRTMKETETKRTEVFFSTFWTSIGSNFYFSSGKTSGTYYYGGATTLSINNDTRKH